MRSLTVGMKNWATGIARTIMNPDIRREKYYHGIVMMKMNPAFIEGSRRGFTGKFFDVIGFSDVVRFNRMAISEMGRAWLEQDALSDLRRGGEREQTARRFLKNRFLMSDDEIDQPRQTISGTNRVYTRVSVRSPTQQLSRKAQKKCLAAQE